MRKLFLPAIIGGPILVLILGSWLAGERPSPRWLASGTLRGTNVLLVTIDSLRADHVGAYGRDGSLTPTLDALAKDGLVFDRTYAQTPFTRPSIVSLLTAADPARLGIGDDRGDGLAEPWPTIASTLKSAGYRTGAFVGTELLDARFGTTVGFDAYDAGEVERSAEQVLVRALAWIANQAEPGTPSPEPGALPPVPETRHQEPVRRWFAWIHLHDPHTPYSPPEPFKSRYASEGYDGEIAYTDAALGGFIARLRVDGALGETLVVVVSDYGASVDAHGEQARGALEADARLRVPLMMWAPGRILPGVFAGTMRLVDLGATILDLVGAAPLPNVDGKSAAR